MSEKNIPGGACSETRNRLDAYLDGELPEAERNEVDSHLAACPACTGELDLRQRLKRRLGVAVRGIAMPEGLEARVRTAIRSEQKRIARPWYGSMRRIAAGIAVLAVLGIGGRQLKQRLDQEGMIDELSAHLAQVFRPGFGDHLHCALFRESKHPVVQELIEKTLVEPLGPEYEEVRQLVADRRPDGLDIWMAHRCEYRDREFIHVALRGEGKLMSVILTRKKPGESFADVDVAPLLVSGDLSLHRAAVEEFQLAGFESAGHLVFVVSNLSAAENIETAAALGPSLDMFLNLEDPA